MTQLVRLKEIGMNDFDAFKLIAKWSNDSEIRPYFTPRFSKAPYEDIKPHELMLSLMSNPCKHSYLICVDGFAVGEASIDLCFQNCMNKEEQTAWIGVVIGESEYRGKGLGREVMSEIETECRTLGANAIELGVFSYNERARHLYETMGYKRIGTIEKFVYNFNRWHDDIRMLKAL
ncbi:MAG: hypothetical protein PWQ12_162 [Clostridiales bacterium]|nr:hypothetical protein [Clostridiales bacterium]